MFSVLTSKIFGGLSVVLFLTLMAVTVAKNNEIDKLEASIVKKDQRILVLQQDNMTLRANEDKLEAGLQVCNASIANTAATADRINAAGVAALTEVKKAGAAVSRKAAQIDAMPANTCEDADAILRAGGD